MKISVHDVTGKRLQFFLLQFFMPFAVIPVMMLSCTGRFRDIVRGFGASLVLIEVRTDSSLLDFKEDFAALLLFFQQLVPCLVQHLHDGFGG